MQEVWAFSLRRHLLQSLPLAWGAGKGRGIHTLSLGTGSGQLHRIRGAGDTLPTGQAQPKVCGLQKNQKELSAQKRPTYQLCEGEQGEVRQPGCHEIWGIGKTVWLKETLSGWGRRKERVYSRGEGGKERAGQCPPWRQEDKMALQTGGLGVSLSPTPTRSLLQYNMPLKI